MYYKYYRVTPLNMTRKREDCAVLTIAAQTANSIHIRVTFNAVTRYNLH